MKFPVKLVKEAGKEFLSDNAITLAAAVAFYTALSFAPLLLLLVTVGAFLGPDTQDALIEELKSLIGPQSGDAIRMVLENAAQRPSLGNAAGIFGMATLLFSATGVFAQLQKAINIVWNVKPKKGEGVKAFLRKRLFSLGMILAIAFLLVVSLVVSTVIAVVFSGEAFLWRALHFVISILIFTALFGIIFKCLPDVKIAWRDVLFGGAATATLFALGKLLIGLYLGNSSVGSAYGAAGSLIVLLLWVYYSAIIFFFGAELTQVQARLRGARIQPDKHAEWADEPARQQPA
jgi:membrane protein